MVWGLRHCLLLEALFLGCLGRVSSDGPSCPNRLLNPDCGSGKLFRSAARLCFSFHSLLIHSLRSCLISRQAYINTLPPLSPLVNRHFLTFFFFFFFHLHQGALLTGRQTRRLQVPASIQLRALLRSAAAQREDEGGAGEGVQEGCGRSPRPAGYRPLPVAGILHPHTC